MNEGDLKDTLVRTLRQTMVGAAIFRHEDKFTAGIPDISVNWRGFTTWIEVKYLNPDFIGKEIQYVTALKLEREARCLYALYVQRRGERRTVVVKPSELKRTLEPGVQFTFDPLGFDHRYVARRIGELYVYGKE